MDRKHSLRARETHVQTLCAHLHRQQRQGTENDENVTLYLELKERRCKPVIKADTMATTNIDITIEYFVIFD